MRLPESEQLVAMVESRTTGRPAAERLGLAIQVGRELSDMGDELIGRFVGQARDAGLSWTEIGLLFGTSKQAVHQRYGGVRTQPGAWSPAAETALGRAADEARRLGHDYVGTEHALLALASTAGGDIAADVLAGLGVSRERILATSCMLAQGHVSATAEWLPLMPRFKQALELARRIADGLGAPTAGSEHLLAGLVAVPDGMAVQILRRLKVRPDAVRRALAERLDAHPDQLGAARRSRRRRS